MVTTVCLVIQYEAIDWADCDGLTYAESEIAAARRHLAEIRARNAHTFAPETWRMVRRTVTETVEE